LFKSYNRIVECYGISQDPTTKNYVMVMKYIDKGNLRQYLQERSEELSLGSKLSYLLTDIAEGLKSIHYQDLVHWDLHSGNVLVKFGECYITDLGLSELVNSQKKDGKIFGVLPYVAPEVLMGKTYTQASDVYSFGIVAYELLANAYPYTDTNLEGTNLALKICRGLRPNIDKVSIPQLLKDLIKSC
jgi:serine/threonine protein kinase